MRVPFFGKGKMRVLKILPTTLSAMDTCGFSTVLRASASNTTRAFSFCGGKVVVVVVVVRLGELSG